jgi:gluconolactonase
MGIPNVRWRVFYDGFLRPPRLDHPECVAVHPDGSVWCGGEAGQVFRIEADGSSAEQVASTGGFILGIAFDRGASALYLCDIAARAVFRMPLSTCVPLVFAEGADGHRFRNPNSLVFDSAGRLYVSDSYPASEPGPPVFRFAPDGAGEVWCDEPMSFANGLALDRDEAVLYVAESFLPGVTSISIAGDGSAGRRDVVARLPGTVPDAWPSARTACCTWPATNRARCCGCFLPRGRRRPLPAIPPPTCCVTPPTLRSGMGLCSPPTWAAGTSPRSKASDVYF